MPQVQGKSRTSWRAKLYKPTRTKMVPISNAMAKRFGQGMMLIPTALELDAMIRKIPRGEVSTLAQVRSRLARWYKVDLTCPLVSGIYLRIVAEAAEEDQLAGRPDVTPFWRVVGDDGKLNPKFPGGIEAQARHLREEGHRVEKGKIFTPDSAVTAA